MSTMNWLTLVGAPTIILSIITGVFTYIVKRIKAIKLGIQAILRDRLYELYRECKKQGSANEFERENFENLYKQYHNLGANGVMDDVYKKFLALPMSEDD